MFETNSPEVKENSRKRRIWEQMHPDQNWKTGLSKEQIEEIEKQRKTAS
ncbi:MAG: hypothetical protein Q8P30_01470 [Candidatus Uhrbacteria bacterium]|nr:hypothetical protein [Candidatus Uhrbacteria bacterium]